MANSLNSNPVILTTTQTSYKAAVVASQGVFVNCIVEKWYWEAPTAVGDQVVIIDPQSGAEKLRLRCELALQSQVVDWTAHPKQFSDFAAIQMDSGRLYIYMR